jgi:hypothetical protein
MRDENILKWCIKRKEERKDRWGRNIIFFYEAENNITIIKYVL